jgi:hypothetical protein
MPILNIKNVHFSYEMSPNGFFASYKMVPEKNAKNGTSFKEILSAETTFYPGKSGETLSLTGGCSYFPSPPPGSLLFFHPSSTSSPSYWYSSPFH